MQTGESKAVAGPVKKNLFLASCLATCVLALAASVVAQEPSAPGGAQQPTPSASDKTATSEQANEGYIQLMREDIRAERKKIVAANLPLTEAEATKFWPVYDRYIAETIKVNDVRYGLIKEYAKNYETLTDAQATSYIKRWMALDADNTQLRLKYVPEFEKVISPKKTAMFFQIDRRISMLIELQLAGQVPLVKP